jgi:hypothetical protein
MTPDWTLNSLDHNFEEMGEEAKFSAEDTPLWGDIWGLLDVWRYYDDHF